MEMNSNNQQITPQMLMQALNQMLQQNGQIPNQVPQPMNWNMPTNPMAAMWMNNMMGMMNNQNQNANHQQNQQNSPQIQQPQQTESMDPAVRIIKTPDEIKADEIPMNGSLRLFLQEDMNVIHGKRWTNNGVIENIRFIREDEPEKEAKNPVMTDSFIDMNDLVMRISQMVDTKLDDFKAQYIGRSKPNPKSSSKKEVNEDGE